MRYKAIVVRVIKELLRDKRTLALMLFAPILVLTLMYFIFDTNTESNLNIGFDENVPEEMMEEVPTDKVDSKRYATPDSMKKFIEKTGLDAFVEKKESTLYITYKNEDPSNTEAVKQVINGALQKNKMQDMLEIIEKAPKDMMKQKPKDHDLYVDNHYLYGDENSTFFDKIFPILIGFFVFFFVFLISGIALIRERTQGTLERLLATSIKRSEVVFGYLTGYGIFAVIQTLIIVAYSVLLLKVDLVGSIWWVILINILVALAALAMGIFVSTFANTEFQMIQFIPLVVIPQIFFSGIIPLNNVADWMSVIGYLFPLRYAGDALTNIMIKGQGLEYIWVDISVLLVFILGFTLLNIIGLKRYRKV